MQIIIILIIAMYFILIAWTWQNLGKKEKTKKVVFIIIGISISYLVTLIIFNISKNRVNYQDLIQQMKAIKRILVPMFTALNGIIFIPYSAKIFNKMIENEIKNDKVIKKVILLIFIIVIFCFIECSYLTDIQNGIINVYNSKLVAS